MSQTRHLLTAKDPLPYEYRRIDQLPKKIKNEDNPIIKTITFYKYDPKFIKKYFELHDIDYLYDVMRYLQKEIKRKTIREINNDA